MSPQVVSTLVWVVLIGLVLWLFMIRPQQRRQAAALDLQRSIGVGDDVVLTSGILGTVAEMTDDHIAVEVAEGVQLRVLRGAIASKVHRDDEAADDVDDNADHDSDGAGDGVDGED